MKLIPLVLVFSVAYFCGSLRDRFQPSQPPTPGPAANIPEPVASPANTPSIGMVPTMMVSGGALNDKAKTMPSPPYPAAARAVRASGEVTVQVVVDETGRVISASAISGHPLLREAAEQAARTATFEPTTLSGRAVKLTGTLTYAFRP